MRFSVLLALVLGVLIGVGWRTLGVVPVATVFLLLVMAFGAAVVWRRKSFAFSPPYPMICSLFLVGITLGVLRTEVASWQFDNSLLETSLGNEVTLVGDIVREPDHRAQTVQLSVRVDNDLIMVSTDRLTEFSYGDRVKVIGRLERPGSFETDLGRTFNYAGYLRAKGIEYRISFAEVLKVSSGHGNPIIGTLLAAKQHFIASIRQYIPEPQVGLGSGLLLGVKSALGQDIEDDFRKTGIIHIVVLSGYNVMLVVAFIMFCFSFFLPLRARVVVGIVAIAAFAFIVGLSATVVRASVMAVLVLLAQALSRRHDVLRALLFAGVLMILINPYLLVYDIGFQLSFMATLGLILIIPQFELLGLQGKQWFGIKEFFLATLATQIAVLPLLMYHIGEVSIIALVVNVLVLPIVPIAMLLTFVSGMIGFISTSLALPVAYLANVSLTYILAVAGWFADVPYAAVSVPAFSVVGVFFAYGVMLAGWWYVRQRANRVDNEFADWVIETEPAGESDDSPAGSSEVPVFFR